MNENKPKIAFFQTKGKDQDIFEEINQQFNLPITFFASPLTAETVQFAKGHQVICAKGAMIDEALTKKCEELGIKLIAFTASQKKTDMKNVSIISADAQISAHEVAQKTLASISSFFSISSHRTDPKDPLC